MKPFASLLTATFASLLLTAPAGAQSDDFNDLNDTGWTRYKPLADIGAATASYTFTGGVYRIASTESQVGAAGPARAGAIRPEIYGTFCVMVDLVNWNPAEDASFGVLARISSPGLGTTNGYSFTFQGQDNDVQISRIDGEAPTSLSGSPAVTLTVGGDYRMVFFGIGGQLEGRIYDMAAPLVPLVVATGTDATYAGGTCGLVVFSDSNTATSATFDNYLANNGVIAPPALTIGGGELKLTWDVESGLAHTLESSVDLADWFPLAALDEENGEFLYYEPFGGFSAPAAHFRLRLGAPPAVGAAP
jgi:hypothetical protein